MLRRRLSLLLVLIPVFAFAGPDLRPAEAPQPAQPEPKEVPKPPAGWTKDRLAEIDKILDAEIKDLVALYQHIHTNPELSLMEEKTAKRLADEMRKLGYDVTEKFGGHGVVAVLKNGDGPVLLIRTDMDGLPIVEQTGLPYASTVKVKNRDGIEVGVMHACGHDIHMASWIGTARVLAGLKDRWSGTVIFIAQPAEEIVAGAKLMLDAGLYAKFPKPDYALALHSDPHNPVGTVGYSEGLALANSDTVDILV
jgi:amidohydrolase